MRSDVVVGYFVEEFGSALGKPIRMGELSSLLETQKADVPLHADIVGLLRYRIQSRFLSSVLSSSGKLHHTSTGFTSVALSSLLIETFGCYESGIPGTDRTKWPDPQPPANPQSNLDHASTRAHAKADNVISDYWNQLRTTHPQAKKPSLSVAVFGMFFINNSSRWNNIGGVNYGRRFFQDVRCGLLHQGETKGEWLISKTNESTQKVSVASNRVFKVVPAEKLAAVLLAATSEFISDATKPGEKHACVTDKLQFVLWQCEKGSEENV